MLPTVTRTRAVLAAIVVTLLPLGVSAQTASPVTVRIIAGVGGDSTSEPQFANDLGLFARNGLAVTMSGSGGGAAGIAAVAGGSAEICFTNTVSAAAAIQRGLPLMILLPAAIFTSKAPDILLMKARGSALKTGADLAGKTVGVPTLSGEMQLGAEMWIEKTGGDAKSVHFVEVPSSSMRGVLKTGRVDAVMMAEPYLADAKPDAEQLGDALGAISPLFIDNVWVASKAWVVAHPEAARKFVAVMLQTARWANAHRAESAKMLAQTSRVDLATIQSMTRSTYGDSLDAAQLQLPVDAAVKYGILKTPVDMRGLAAEARTYWSP